MYEEEEKSMAEWNNNSQTSTLWGQKWNRTKASLTDGRNRKCPIFIDKARELMAD